MLQRNDPDITSSANFEKHERDLNARPGRLGFSRKRKVRFDDERSAVIYFMHSGTELNHSFVLVRPPNAHVRHSELGTSTRAQSIYFVLHTRSPTSTRVVMYCV